MWIFGKELFIFLILYCLPDSKTRCLTRTLDLNGFDSREYGTDMLLIFCLTIQQLNAVTSWALKHMYTTQKPRRTPSGSTDGILLKQDVYQQENVKTGSKHLFSMQLKTKEDGTISRTKGFSPNWCNCYAELAMLSLAVLNARNHLHPACTFSTAFCLGCVSTIRLLVVSTGIC